MKKIVIRAALLSAVFSLAVAVPVWAATVTDFAKTFTVTVPAEFADAPVADFPLLVRLGSGIQGFDYADFRQNGADILVTDTDGQPLPHELENWDTNGESRLWVQVPSVAEGTTIRVYYGTDATVDEVDGMWSGYAGVWHLNEADDGAVQILDSTTNHLDGVAASGNKGSLAVAGGQLGGARRIAQDNDHAPGIIVLATNGLQKTAADRLGTDFHASFWLRSRAETTDFSDLKWGNIIGRRKGDKGTSWGFAFHGEATDANQSKYMRVFAGSTTITTTTNTIGELLRETTSDTWKKVDVVWKYASNGNASVADIYTNGVLASVVALKEAVALQDANIGIGCSTQDQYGSSPDAKKGRRLNGEMDEVRLRYGASTAARIAAEWRQESGALTAVCSEVGLVDSGAPTVSAPSIVRNADGTFTVSTVVSDNDAASVKCLVGNAEFAMTSDDATLPKTYAATLSGLAADTTFAYSVQAMSAGGDTLIRNGVETFYTGDLSVAKVQDGDEDGLVPGVFRISRASEDAQELPVSFTLGGTAIEGRSYQLLEKTATIPAGAAFVDVEILPLIDSIETAATVELALAPGLYGVSGTAGSATLSIENLTLDATKNTWIASDAGLASDGANWSFGHAPLATEHVLFDGRFSNADCEWDETATHEVAAWTQNNGYAGKVTLRTVFPGKGAFTNLVVSGALTVDAGSLTHPQSRIMGGFHKEDWDWLGDLKANETYRIRVSAGSLHVGAGGLIDARGMGYYVTNNGSRVVGCSHGGRMNAGSPPCYGDPREPIHIGMPHHQSDNRWNGKGGGAIYLDVAGAAVVDGTIRADAWDGSLFTGPSDYGGAMGAGGSVFLRADTLTGTGRITAMGTGAREEGIGFDDTGYRITTDGNFKGTGGRVAIATRVPVDRSTFAAISAVGYWMGSLDVNWTARFAGGSGTVVFRDATRPNGLLVIAQQTGAYAPNLDRAYPTFWRYPSVTDEGDWTFDAIEFGHRGFLGVPVGTTLTLPGGLASCYGTAASSDTCGGIRYEGGTIAAGAGDQTLSGNWMFVPWSNYVFSASVVVTNGAAIGFHPVTDVLDDPSVSIPFPSASFEVTGNLLVCSNAAIRAIDCGAVSTNETSTLLLGQHSHGGRSIYRGRNAASGALESQAYDSVFAPRLPGSTAGAGLGVGVTSKTQRSGGAVRVVVGGTLTLDGEATVSGQTEDRTNLGGRTGGAGGALDVTAGRLAGAGTMRANGGNYNDFSGPGGRIAVRLTTPGADFTAFTGRIEAGGGSWRKGGAIDPTPDASAGTVYLETAADGDKCGTIRIAMDPRNAKFIQDRIKSNSPANTNTTEMVSLGFGGDDIKAYKKARYIIANYGRAAVNTDFRAQSVTLADETAALDLEGHTLTLRDFFWVTRPDGSVVTNKLKAGTYSYNNLKSNVGNCIEDTSAGQGGSVVILQNNLIIRLR